MHFDVDLMRDSGREFPPRPINTSIRSLRIWHCRYRTLVAIGTFRQLEILDIGSFPDSTFDALAELRRLRWLRVLHLPLVKTLDALAGLDNLRCLSLSTAPGWDAGGKVTRIESLEPIARIAALEHLELFGVVPPDKSLAPLERSRALRTVRVSKYPKKEVERFRAATSLSDAFMPTADAA